MQRVVSGEGMYPLEGQEIMAGTPEGKVKLAIKKILDKHEAWFFMPVQNGMGKVGIPDFVCCYKGHFLGIEAKAPGKMHQTTPNQDKIRDEIEAHSGSYIVIDDPQMLDDWITSINVYNRMNRRNP
jgi:hypothetical protein